MSILLHWAVSSFTPDYGPRAWHKESGHENFIGFRSFSNNFNIYTCLYDMATFFFIKRDHNLKEYSTFLGKKDLVEFLYKDEISKEPLK